MLGEVQRRQVAHLYVSAVTGTATLEDQCGEAGAGALLGGHLVDGAVYGSGGAGRHTVEHQRRDGLGQRRRQGQGVEHVAGEHHHLQGLDVAETAQELSQQLAAVLDVVIVRA